MTTHYLEIKKPIKDRIFKNISNACKSLYEKEEFLSIIGDWDGYNIPVFNSDQISFNGIGNFIGDSFSISKKDQIGLYQFKTNDYPYDLFVRSCLFIFKHYLDEDVQIGSDKDDNLWTEANILINELLDIDEDFRIDGVIS